MERVISLLAGLLHEIEEFLAQTVAAPVIEDGPPPFGRVLHLLELLEAVDGNAIEIAEQFRRSLPDNLPSDLVTRLDAVFDRVDAFDLYSAAEQLRALEPELAEAWS